MVEEAAKEAADRSVDEGRLLEGEDPETVYLEDATHWAQVYAELLAVKRDLLGTTEARLGTLPAEARKEVATTDLLVLDAEMRRFSRRLDYWRQRCVELGGAQG